MSNATQSELRHSPSEQPGNPRSAFGGIEKSTVRGTSDRLDFAAIQQSEEFRRVRRRLKWFAFPATAFILIWFVAFLAAGAYFPEFMGRRLFGEINIGLLMALGQFVSTAVLTSLYLWFTRRKIDPRVDEIRQGAGELQL